MSKHYLRVEAVNLNNFIVDTQDLSTIRGGSLLLLHAVEGLKDEFSNIEEFKEVSTGASVGLYEFEADDNTASEIRDRVEDWLRNKEGLHYATIMVDVQKAGVEFGEDVQALTARNRWRQAQSQSIVLDAKPSDKLCEVDKVRPAFSQLRIHDEDRWVSQSVIDRRRYGRDMKQRFYQEEIGRSRNEEVQSVHHSKFVWDLEELANDPGKGNLHHKIAIIYLDGNRFGRIKQNAGNSRDVWEKFDQDVKSLRRQMLNELLETMGHDPDWQSGGRYRIETLLWGGDEIIWVVPAWKGWETLNHFYESSQRWLFNNEPLRHAGGIIFCHHNAPIHRLTRLVRDLAEQAKIGDGRNHNRFAYEVLESFDHVGSDFDAYRRSRCVQPLDLDAKADQQSLILDARQMSFLRQQIGDLEESLSRRKLHDVVEEFLTPFDIKAGESDEERYERLKQRREHRATTIRDFKDRLRKAAFPDTRINEIEQRLGGETSWVHIQGLWDYLI
jgi:hypothetical protein